MPSFVVLLRHSAKKVSCRWGEVTHLNSYESLKKKDICGLTTKWQHCRMHSLTCNTCGFRTYQHSFSSFAVNNYASKFDALPQNRHHLQPGAFDFTFIDNRDCDWTARHITVHFAPFERIPSRVSAQTNSEHKLCSVKLHI